MVRKVNVLDVHTASPRPFAEGGSSSAGVNTPMLSGLPLPSSRERVGHANASRRQQPRPMRIPRIGREAITSIVQAIERTKLVRPANFHSPPQVRPKNVRRRSEEVPKVSSWLNQILGPSDASTGASSTIESSLVRSMSAAAPFDNVEVRGGAVISMHGRSLDQMLADQDSSEEDEGDDSNHLQHHLISTSASELPCARRVAHAHVSATTSHRGEEGVGSSRAPEPEQQNLPQLTAMRRSRRSIVLDDQVAQYQSPRAKPKASEPSSGACANGRLSLRLPPAVAVSQHRNRSSHYGAGSMRAPAVAGGHMPPAPVHNEAEKATMKRSRASTVDGALLLSLKGEAPEAQANRHWELVRQKLWRLLNPAAAFSRIIRRTLFTYRACCVLRAIPCFASKATEELSAMVNAACELALPRYTCLYREQSTAEGLYILVDGTLEHTIGNDGTTLKGGSSAEMTEPAFILIGNEVLTDMRCSLTLHLPLPIPFAHPP